MFDVGGGTTDFTLIAVDAERRTCFERTAVGDHLLLGGDNMDLALARRVESAADAAAASSSRTRSSSSSRRAGSRRSACSATTRAQRGPITVAGRGSKLIGGTLRDELARAEVEELVLDGFFPLVAADARAASGARAGSRSSACRTPPIRRSRATSPRSCSGTARARRRSC